MTVKIVIRREVPKDKEKKLLPLIKGLRIATTRQAGYISGETLQRIDKPGETVVVSTWETADVIGTYIYRAGIEGGSLSYSTAVGLVLAVVAFILLYITNKMSKSVSDIYLW